MRLAVLLFCCALVFGQNISSSPETQSQVPANSPDQKSQKQDYGLGTGAPGRQMGALDILSDTQGVNFGPYLQQILQSVRENWYHLIPESASKKQGELAIEFAIQKDGKVAKMHLTTSSGDVALDRPAWGSITASNPFPPLPSEFTGPHLALRFRFYYNPDKSDLQDTQQRFGSFDGSWEGDLSFLQGATLSQKEQTTARYRISIQGMKVRVFVVRSADVKEIKPSKFHVDFLMTNAVVYAMESGHDNEGTWVETWVFTLTQIDKDTVLTNFSRMVNNLDLPLASDHSKFAKEAAGKLRRISDDTATQAPPNTGGNATTQTISAGATAADVCSGGGSGGNKGEAGHFAALYPWYVHVIQSKVSEKWQVNEVDPQATSARVCLNFDINRVGEPSNVRIMQSSGLPSLDDAALHAVSRVSSFGPLPADWKGDKVSVLFWFDYKPKARQCTAEDYLKSSGSKGENGLRVWPEEGLKVSLGNNQMFRVIGTSLVTIPSWSVEGEQCKANDCGSVSVMGLYTAPRTMPPNPEIALKVQENTQPCRIGTTRLTLIPEAGR